MILSLTHTQIVDQGFCNVARGTLSVEMVVMSKLQRLTVGLAKLHLDQLQKALD